MGTVEPTSECLDDDAASAFVEGRATADEVERIEAHVDRCPACRQHIVQLVRARTNAGTPATGDRRLLTGGTVLGRYEILRVVGLGSMGVVYAAYDSQLKRELALKFVRAQASQDRLLREAHALARLRHPNVVAVYDIGNAGDRVFIAMELIDGVTLTERLRRPHDRDEVIELFIQAARGLHAAHDAGLVHRDFKPDNVLVGNDGRVWVTDFGLARASAIADDVPADAIVGTPAYMAPEQHLGNAVDARSDQFGFCVALYEALYGQRPFEGSTTRELARNVSTGAIRRSRDRRVPRRLAKIVARGLATAPEDRYPSLAVIADELALARRSRAPIVLGAALGVGAIAASVAWFSSSPAVDSCAASAALVDEVWIPTERIAQLARFGALRPRERPMIESSARLVDEWASAWRLGRRTACTVEGAQRAARLGCLDQQLAELRAQVAVWRTADADIVDRALAAAAALPSPAACATHTVVAIAPEVGARIARLNVLDRAGQAALAKSEVPALLALVEKSGNPAAIGAALVASARIDHVIGDLATARDRYARAAREAARADDDVTLFAAMTGEAAVVVDQGRALDALGLIGAAEALSVRAKLERTEAIARARGNALTEAGKQREAIAELERALVAVTARAERDPGARGDVAAVLGAIAAAHTQQYDYQEAHDLLVRVLEIEQRIYGPDHPELAKTLHDLGTTEARLGTFDEALGHLKKARAIFVAAYGERHSLVGGADMSIGSALVQQGKPEDARMYYTRSWDLLSAILPADSAMLITAAQGLAVLEDRIGSCEKSIPLHQRVIALLERNGRGGPDLANEQINVGACLAEVGRLAEARPAIEAGLAGMTAAGVSDLDLCQPWMVLADLEWREGHKPAAIALWRKILAVSAGVDRPDIAQVREYVGGELAKATK